MMTTAPASDVSKMTGVTGSTKQPAKPAPVGSKVDLGTIKKVGLLTFVLEGEEFNFLQNTYNGMIPDTSWLRLDSQSTCGVVKNRRLLANIHDCEPVTMHSQGGQTC